MKLYIFFASLEKRDKREDSSRQSRADIKKAEVKKRASRIPAVRVLH